MNLAAGMILFAVHLSMLLRGQAAIVSLAIGMHLLIDVLLLPLNMGSLAGDNCPRATP